MKGNAPDTGKKSIPAYAGGDSKVAKESREGDNGFKRGGKTNVKADALMSTAHAGRKERKSGGGVFSSAASGSPRKPSSHY